MAATTLTQRQTEASAAEPVPLAALAGGPPRATALLALDLGQRLGWALRLPDGVIASGTHEFRPSRFEGGGMVYLRFRCWLERIHAVNRVGLVVFEEVRAHAGTASAHSYGGWLAILTAWCEAERLPYEGVPVGTIKRHITGKGNADKRAVIEAVKALGFTPADDNEADALALLHWAICHRAGDEGVSPIPIGQKTSTISKASKRPGAVLAHKTRTASRTIASD